MAFFLTIIAVFLLLVISEFWYRKKTSNDEFSRKFIHITVGSFVAFWPFFLSWNSIRILSIAFLVTISISRALGIFQAIHSVQRPTWGEVYFAIAVGAITFITHNKWIYAAALLQMSLADGLAAVIGTRHGGRYKYLVFNHVKSLAGTLTFFVVSVTILLLFNGNFPTQLELLPIVGISLMASFIENVFATGLDNLLVPVLISLLLIQA
jgi:phytol kinase